MNQQNLNDDEIYMEGCIHMMSWSYKF